MKSCHIVLVGLAACFAAHTAQAADITVPIDYPTIQEAIDAAQENDRILVQSGVYEEAIRVQKRTRLELIGVGMPVIEAVGRRSAFRILGSSRIKVSGFEFRGENLSRPVVEIARSERVKLRDSSIGPAGAGGLLLDETFKVKISNLLVHDTDQTCILVVGPVDKTDLKKNKLRDCGWSGIFVFEEALGMRITRNSSRRTGSGGILVDRSSEGGVDLGENTVFDAGGRCYQVGSGSRVVDNKAKGCTTRGFTAYGDENLFRGNRSRRSPCGFQDWGDDNRVEDNDWTVCD